MGLFTLVRKYGDNPRELRSGDNSYYDQGLGSFSDSTGMIDAYNFSPLITDRSYGGNTMDNIQNNALNVGGSAIGFVFGGDSFNVYSPKP